MNRLMQFIKFGLVGVVNTITSYAVYSLCIYLGAHYILASVAGFLISVLVSYLLNSTFVFKDKNEVWWKTLLKSYLSYGFTGLIITNIMLWVWIDAVDISQYIHFSVFELSSHKMAEYIAPLLNIFITIPINYILNKYWAYNQSKDKSIVITGCTGAVGYAIIDYALNHKMKVLAIARPETKALDSFKDNKYFLLYECDLKELKNIKAEGSYSYFIHLAWQSSFGEDRNNKEIQQKNAEYTKDAVLLAEKFHCKKFIGAGSQAEYGLTDKKITEETPLNPISEYGKAKIDACNAAKELCKEKSIVFIWPRLFSVYGINEKTYTFTSTCILSFLKNECPPLSPCEQLWDYINSEDVARAYFFLLEKAPSGEIYNIAYGKQKKLSDFAAIIYDEISPECILKFGERDYNNNQVMSMKADTSKISKLGFYPKISFKDGIKELISYEKDKRVSTVL